MRTKLFVLPLLVALLTSLIAPALVQGAVASQTVVGQIGGVTSGVVLSGGQLYFNVGPRIVRMAVPDASPGAPTLPGVYGGILPGIPEDLKVANGFVYVAMGRDGVAVVDGTTLQVLGVQLLPASAFAAAVAVGPQRLYVAAGNDGIVSYDLGVDKKTLTFSATKSFTGPVRNLTDVEIINSGGADLLFAAANNFTATPADKGGVMRFDVTGTPDPGTATHTVQIDANALAVTASTVYAAGDDTFFVLAGSTLATSGSVALAGPAVQLALRPSGNWVYVTSGSGIDAVNVTNPAAPAVATLTPLITNGFARSLATGEFAGSTSTMLYVADFSAGLTIATSLLATPQTLAVASGSYVMPKPADTSVVGGAAHQGFPFSNSATLWTVSSADPSALSVVGSGLTPVAPIRSLTTYNNLLLASVDTAGLSRYTITAGAEPSGVSTFATGGTAYASAVAWPNAAVADGANGLTVVNISGTMSLVGNAPVADISLSSYELVDVKGSLAFVYDNDGTGHVRIYDLTTPASPAARGVLTQTGVLDLKVSGNYLFLACGVDGVRVANISNPDAPAFVGGADYATAGSAQSLALYNSYLVIAERAAGVEVVAIAPAGTLTNVTTVDTAGNAIWLALVPADNLYVADQNGGMVTIQSSLLGVKWDTVTASTSDLPDPSVVGQPVVISFTVSTVAGTPTGNVTVTDGSASCLGSVAAGACTITPTVAGTLVFTATYAGDATFNTSSGTFTHTVNQAATVATIVSDSPDPSLLGQPVPISYTVSVSPPGSGLPTGNVTVSDGTNSCIGTVAAGMCSLTLTTPGMITLTASYAGDANFLASVSAGAAHRVNYGIFLPLVSRQ